MQQEESNIIKKNSEIKRLISGEEIICRKKAVCVCVLGLASKHE